jgi:hypothetical protein
MVRLATAIIAAIITASASSVVDSPAWAVIPPTPWIRPAEPSQQKRV